MVKDVKLSIEESLTVELIERKDETIKKLYNLINEIKNLPTYTAYENGRSWNGVDSDELELLFEKFERENSK